jgi:hypothetical protein
LMIILIALLFRRFLTRRLVDQAENHAVGARPGRLPPAAAPRKSSPSRWVHRAGGASVHRLP